MLISLQEHEIIKKNHRNHNSAGWNCDFNVELIMTHFEIYTLVSSFTPVTTGGYTFPRFRDLPLLLLRFSDLFVT